MFNPAKAASEIKQEYIDYIGTLFHFRNSVLQEEFRTKLSREISRGPFLEIKDPFRSGCSLRDFIKEGIISPLFETLEEKSKKPKLPLDRPLYRHQELAIRKIISGENVVISTGTGSGKTNCFMIPVLNELLREREVGTLNAGVRAIFIYPMNALANDQIKSLREILMNYPEISFGVYNGGTEHEEAKAIALYESMHANEESQQLRKRLPNELLSREEMQKNPPNILFTNYAMLEHMLFRPKDDEIFRNANFKFVVLDEAHVYSGATGIETAFLMGRLKGRITGSPQFVLTSATLGDGSVESNNAVADFAFRLTGCSFNRENVIKAEREKAPKPNIVIPLDKGELVKLATDNDMTSEEQYDVIAPSDLYCEMRELDNLIEFNEFVSRLQLSEEEAVAFVSLAARSVKDGKPLVDIRYHYFLRALDGCFLALDYPDSLSLTRKNEYRLDSGEQVPMFEISLCEDCGDIALRGKISASRKLEQTDSDSCSYFQLLSQDFNPENNFDDNVFLLCKHCGKIVQANMSHNPGLRCHCDDKHLVLLRKIEPTETGLIRCENCGGNMMRFQLGYDAATAVIATSLYEQIPLVEYNTRYEPSENVSDNPLIAGLTNLRDPAPATVGGQFVVFTDNRQSAAKFASYLSNTYMDFLQKRALWHVLSAVEDEKTVDLAVEDEKPVDLSYIISRLKTYFDNHNLFRENNSKESKKEKSEKYAWLTVLKELRDYTKDNSLVSLGKMSFSYKVPSQWASILAKNYGCSEEVATTYLNYVVLELVRSKKIINTINAELDDEDRKDLFYTMVQQSVSLNEDGGGTSVFLPKTNRHKDGTISYTQTNLLRITKRAFGNCTSDKEAYELMKMVFVALTNKEEVSGFKNFQGRGYVLNPNALRINVGNDVKLWKCNHCGKVTQFNIDEHCIHAGCSGELVALDCGQTCSDNHYAHLYGNERMEPLFVKEHTAQLNRLKALEYQQDFVQKNINALSSSTTFEMGVDVGDLETVFLRNIPPLASNYVQRVGRAGRSSNAAAFALTYARLSSHDFNFFNHPQEMIEGRIAPPNFSLENEKILKRHIYDIALGMFFASNEEMYNGNRIKRFVDDKGYLDFEKWLKEEPESLQALIQRSIKLPGNEVARKLSHKYLDTFEWIDEFVGENGSLTRVIREYEYDIKELEDLMNESRRKDKEQTYNPYAQQLKQYRQKKLIDFLVRGNILPKYGFPVDSVELTQNITDENLQTLNLSRDLSVAISDYAPSAEVVADDQSYTSRYIRKTLSAQCNKQEYSIAYIAKCSECGHTVYSSVPVEEEGKECPGCGQVVKGKNFHASIEPRGGFIAESRPKKVSLYAQKKKYRTEALYVGDTSANRIQSEQVCLSNCTITLDSTINDTLVVKSTDYFYVCPQCGCAYAHDEINKHDFPDYTSKGAPHIEKKDLHKKPLSEYNCKNKRFERYYLHHAFKTDVVCITFSRDTSEFSTMLSVLYALLDAFANEYSIERRDIKGCVRQRKKGGLLSHQLILYDDVPGGAGHVRRILDQNGEALKVVVKRAIKILEDCQCDSSCYGCLRSYENQRCHDQLDRFKALEFLKSLDSTV